MKIQLKPREVFKLVKKSNSLTNKEFIDKCTRFITEKYDKEPATFFNDRINNQIQAKLKYLHWSSCKIVKKYQYRDARIFKNKSCWLDKNIFDNDEEKIKKMSKKKSNKRGKI